MKVPVTNLSRIPSGQKAQWRRKCIATTSIVRIHIYDVLAWNIAISMGFVWYFFFDHFLTILRFWYIDGLMQAILNSIANALALRLSWTNPSIRYTRMPSTNRFSVLLNFIVTEISNCQREQHCLWNVFTSYNCHICISLCHTIRNTLDHHFWIPRNFIDWWRVSSEYSVIHPVSVPVIGCAAHSSCSARHVGDGHVSVGGSRAFLHPWEWSGCFSIEYYSDGTWTPWNLNHRLLEYFVQ